MERFLISPPFGNVFTIKGATSIKGTYTANPRGSNFTKVFRLLKTTRPIRGGWVNKVGLQNNGIGSVKHFRKDKIYSIAALDVGDWDIFFEKIPKEIAVEINLSCPNISKHMEISDAQVEKFLQKYSLVIFKISPTESFMKEAERLATFGAKYFHLFNTLPTDKGGESGVRLKQFALKNIPKLKDRFPEINIIGGGGIYSKDDVGLYKRAGCDYFSIASIFFDPIKFVKLHSFIRNKSIH